MKSVQLALCIALVAIAFVPTAAACCVHTTRSVAWAEYAVVGGELACAVVSAPAPVQQDACVLAIDAGDAFHLAVVDSAVGAVSFSWDACGETGSGLGSGFIVAPAGCESVAISLGPEATAGVLRHQIV